MVEHIVLFRWQDTATSEAVEHVLQGLREMKDQIPEVIDLSCGENFSTRARGYTHALVVRVADRAALDVYAQHPFHQQIIKTRIHPICEEVLAADYEF